MNFKKLTLELPWPVSERQQAHITGTSFFKEMYSLLPRLVSVALQFHFAIYILIQSRFCILKVNKDNCHLSLDCVLIMRRFIQASYTANFVSNPSTSKDKQLNREPIAATIAKSHSEFLAVHHAPVYLISYSRDHGQEMWQDQSAPAHLVGHCTTTSICRH